MQYAPKPEGWPFVWDESDATELWRTLYAGHSLGTILMRPELAGQRLALLAHSKGSARHRDRVGKSCALPAVHGGVVQRLTALAMSVLGQWCYLDHAEALDASSSDAESA